MKPKIDKTKFGSITITGEKHTHDIIIRLDGRIENRKKKLSKQVFGTSHIISLAEADYIYEKGAEHIIIGTGQSDMVKLSDEAIEFFVLRDCQYHLLPTPEAIHLWNKSKGSVVGLFHITC
ncbi:MAG: Mth938-like domain-containing protein [Acidobacteriaceae bacterium]